MLAGRPPASTKGHFYWLKVVGGCLARQQKPVLAARTNRFWPSDGNHSYCNGVEFSLIFTNENIDPVQFLELLLVRIDSLCQIWRASSYYKLSTSRLFQSLPPGI
jgi:hypothetical protein